MSTFKITKASAKEPAERPIMMALSVAEVLAVTNHHLRHMKRLTNEVGKIVMGSEAFTTKGPAMRLAKQQIEAHKARAREVINIATSTADAAQAKREGNKV